MDGAVLVGTSNWSDHQGFYPPGTKPQERIVYYSRLFPLVSVDSTYYSLQPRRNFEAWCERTPEGFLFNVKAYRELTQHNRDDQGRVETPRAETFEKFSYSLQPMRDCGKLRAVQFQFPPWFRYSPENLEYIASCQELLPGDLLTVEFRHRSWLEGENADRTLAFLRERALAYVMVDEPQVGSGSVPPTVAITNPELAVVRFHGRNAETWYTRAKSSTERFKYLYDREELSEWIPPIRQAQREASEVHVLFNNNYGNYAVQNALDIMELLGQPAPKLDLPELPDDQPRLL